MSARPHIRVVLQARVSSIRLPAKVMLPLKGIPLALLCAKRLSNSGLEVVLATSSSSFDDVLVKCFENQFKIFRGSLDDVMGRFIGATNDLKDDDIVVRATADNPLPDGSFLDSLLEQFFNCGDEYLGINHPLDGLPYGASAEVFTVRALRLRNGLASSDYEREHVTPGLQPQGVLGRLEINEIVGEDYSHLRCTIDTLQDYILMDKVFNGSQDAVNVPWIDLVTRLSHFMPPKAGFNMTHPLTSISNRLCLGTAQLGMEYGITNIAGRPSEELASSIIKLALSRGILNFDTARSYDLAESRLGNVLCQARPFNCCVFTKLKPLAAIPDSASKCEVINAIDASVFQSCYYLQQHKLDVLMFHRSQDIVRWDGLVLKHLENLMANGVIRKIGVSVYSPDEAIQCMTNPLIKFIQIPFNLLDRRWCENKFQDALKSRPDLSVQARSLFLQGLLVSDADRWPIWVKEREEIVARLKSLCILLGCENRAALCIAYARAFPWISTFVVGVESKEQLEQAFTYFDRRILLCEEVSELSKELTNIPDRLLDPRLW